VNSSGLEFSGARVSASSTTFMATDTQKYTSERETHHSALTEFQRDERRPAVLLLTILIVAALFFALGIMVGRWTAEPKPTQNTTTTNTSPAINP
jgi:hypothetical protein